MSMSASGNCNICCACAVMDLDQLALPDEPKLVDLRSAPTVVASSPVAAELDHFLKLESPSVLECFAALEQAEQAIAETAASERTSESPRPAPAPAPSGNLGVVEVVRPS